MVTQGSILRDATSAHQLFTSFLILCALAINDEAQQGGQSGFTILAALLSRFCLQIFTGDREQTRTGTGEDFLKEELRKRLSHKNIGFLGKPDPLLPHELTSILCAALSHCPNYKDLCPDLPTSPLQLTAALATHPVPEVYFPKTVHDAEGLQSYPIPDTKGILLHLILPHSLRCPADTYFTQVVSHYPHLHRESDTGELRYGHFEDPLPSIASLRLPVDMQGQTHHISGYRLLHWSPAITQNAHIDRASLDTVLTVAGVLSFFTARSIRLSDENSKLLLLAPHNDTIQDLQDALGTPSPHFPPTLYDFYLTCIFCAMLLPTHISSFARKDHMNQLIEPQPHTISSLDIHQFLSTRPDLINQLLPHATLSLTLFTSLVPTPRDSPHIVPFPTLSKPLVSGELPPFTFQQKLTLFSLNPVKLWRATSLPSLVARGSVYFYSLAPKNSGSLSSTLSVPSAPTGMAFTTLATPLLILIASQLFFHFLTLPSTLNLVSLTKALGSSLTRLATSAHGISFRSPCNSPTKGKLIFLPYVYAPTSRSQIIGKCQQGTSVGRNSVQGHPHLSCFWFSAMAVSISPLTAIIWLPLFSLNETVLLFP